MTKHCLSRVGATGAPTPKIFIVGAFFPPNFFSPRGQGGPRAVGGDRFFGILGYPRRGDGGVGV